MAKKKARKAKRAKKAKRRKVRVKLGLRSVRGRIRKGIKRLKKEADRAEKESRDKTAIAKARKRIKRLEAAVVELKAECPDRIMDPSFTF